MSALGQLKQSVGGVADTATKTGSQLAQFEKQFNQQRQQVQQLIGGSTQGKDREMERALQAASKAVKEATAALQTTAKVARQYAQSL